MKMKKILVVAMTMVMTLSSAVGVMAAGSRSKNVALTGDTAEKFEVAQNIQETESYKALKAEEPETAALIDDVNAGTKSMASFKETLTAMAAEITDETAKAALDEVVKTLENKEFVTGFVDLVAKEGTEKNANGKYEITLSVPGMTDNTTEVEVLHYSTERKVWEVITPSSIDTKNKTIVAEFEDLSPVAVIAKEGSFDAADNAQGTSPKTEGVSTWMMWAAAAVVLLGAGTVVVTRKRNCR